MELLKNIKIEKDSIIVKYIFDIGILLLTFIFSNILVTTILQFLNISMSTSNMILSILVTIISYLLIRREEIKKSILPIVINIIIAFIIVVISTKLMAYTMDFTVDGNSYHKAAVGSIKNGWNPIYEEHYDYILENNPDIANSKTSLWVDHYPKATWNFAASMYSVTDSIETGKVLVFLLMISLVCFTFTYLYDRHLKFFQSGIIAILISISPIVLSQMFSYYVDGIMGLTIYLIILSLVMITDRKFSFINDRIKWVLLLMSTNICMNIKFTGVFFAGIFCILFYLYWLYKSRKEENFKSTFINLTIRFSIIVIIGIGIIGFSTYIQNTVDHNNPLYPLFGEGKVDIITTMQPQSFAEKNRFVKLFESMFSKSENVTYYSGDEPTLKIPFSIIQGEKNDISIPDLRIGGYGVLFSGIFIVSIIIVICSLIVIIKKNRFEDSSIQYILLILFGIIITTIALEESWWARYAPQLYLVPIIALFMLFYLANNINNKKIYKYILNIIAVIFSVGIIINGIGFVYWRYKELLLARSIRLELYNYKNMEKENNNICIEEIGRYGILYNLEDLGIEYKLVKNNDDLKNAMYNSWIKY